MHATAQPGGRSPKPVVGPTSTSQLKLGSDSGPNSGPSVPSQAKGKKRERVDRGSSESVKRECSIKMDDGDSSYYRSESLLKTEIAKIVDKGALVDSEGVAKLVQLMLPERSDRKIDLVGRSILAGVVAATDKVDCLSRFVQLKGLPVFDEWLQEVHKGKIGDANSIKESDKSIEDFLLILLRALDKLPVNLHALQMCNIGKSVNHLRSHKNLEIQKKARSLVDTWKKRVEAEMDAKPVPSQGVSWAARSRLPEGSYGGNRNSGGSSEVPIKGSLTQLTPSKTASIKLVQTENFTRSASTSTGSMKSAPSPASASAGLKEGQPRTNSVGCVPELPPTASRDEKTSSSSPSHDNNQPCLNDPAKMGGFSSKEDSKSALAWSVSGNKNSGDLSRHQKSVSDSPGSATQKETPSSRSLPLQRNMASEKLSHSTFINEKALNVTADDGNNYKLTVKMPNLGGSPTRSASGGPLEDPSVRNSRASSPELSEKSGQFDRDGKEQCDTNGANVCSDVITESWQSNDFKDVLTGSDDGDGSPTAATEEEHCRTIDEANKEVSKTASSSSGNEPKSGNLNDVSFSSINALIESCVMHSEAFAKARDDVGMNLLANVAAGEMSRSDVVAPTYHPQINSCALDLSCPGSVARIKTSTGDELSLNQNHFSDGADGNRGMKYVNGSLNSSSKEVQQNGDQSLDYDEKSKDVIRAPKVALPIASSVEKSSDVIGAKELNKRKEGGAAADVDSISDIKQKISSPLFNEGKVIDSCIKVEMKADEASFGELKAVGKIEAGMTFNHTEQKMEDEIIASVISENQVKDGSNSTVSNHKLEQVEDNLDNDLHEHRCGTAAPSNASPLFPLQQMEHSVKPRKSKLSDNETDELEECTSTSVDAFSYSASRRSDMNARVKFDLNEGFNVDDGKYSDSNNLAAPGSLTQFISPIPFPITSMSNSLTASITVAAAAKGPFVPREDLLRHKGSLGWKGSAATSAFRPAEPRKVLEMPLVSTNISSPDATAGKQSRAPLDIDLNIPDERVLEDLVSQSYIQPASSVTDRTNSHRSTCYDKIASAPVRSMGGFDLDLNRANESTDICNPTASNNLRVDYSFQPMGSSSKSRRTNEMTPCRDFDLNDGPDLNEVCVEQSSIVSHHARSSAPLQPTVSGVRVNNSDMGNFSSWFSAGNTYSAAAIPSILPDRGESPFPFVAKGGPHRVLGPPTGTTPYSPDVFRGPVLSSSPAVPFPSTPFQYPVFSFGTNFPLPSAAYPGASATYVDSLSGGRFCFPAVHSQFLGPAGAVPSNYPRPYVVSLPDGTNNGLGTESNRKWYRQGLDLNAGPGSQEVEGRDETSFALRHITPPVSNVLTEEQARMYQLAGSVLKRKEPEGGWDGYMQSSWQ